jgi:hypothetical protein
VALSMLRIAYFIADFWLGEIVRIRPARRQGRMVIVERGFWDMAVDPHRYRLSLPSGLISFLGRFVPRPDLLLVLDAPVPVLLARKRELPQEELDRQRRAWLHLEVPGVQKVVLDATRPLDEVVRDAREALAAHVEPRATGRLGAGWANLPGKAATRWWLPRAPREVARTGLAVYQPVTPKGRLGWEAARALARIGGLRILPRGEAPPRDVRVRLAEYLPPRTTYAAMRANHAGRYLVLLVDDRGVARGVAKVATTVEGEEALRREAQAIREWGELLPPPVRAPRILAEGPGVLLLAPVPFRPRRRPWQLPEPVARALGALDRAGIAHGDAAPWNLLAVLAGGYVLLDWESAGQAPVRGFDLCHWLVQSHALLGRPRVHELLAGLRGEGPLGPPIVAYLAEAGLALGDLGASLREYLDRTRARLDPAAPDGARGLAAREQLRTVLARQGRVA